MWRLIVILLLVSCFVALTPTESSSFQSTSTPTQTASPTATATFTPTPRPTLPPTPTPTLTFTPGPSPTLSINREPISAETVHRLSVRVTLDCGEVRDLAFSPDNRRIITAGQDGILRLFDILSGEQIAEFAGHGLPVDQVDFLDDETIISMGLDATVRLWDINSPAESNIVLSAPTRIFQFDFFDDWLAIGLADGTVQIWSLATQSKIATLSTTAEAARSVVFNQDGTKLAGGTSRASIYTWDTATWQALEVTTTVTTWVSHVLWADPDNVLGSGYFSHMGDLPDAVLFEIANPLHLREEQEILMLHISNGILLWQFETGEFIWRDSVFEVVNFAVISPDGTLLAKPDRYEGVEVWGVK